MCILGAAPFAAMGFINYHGMNAEQFLWAWLRSELLEPCEFKCEPTSIYYEWLKPRIDARLNGREYKELVKTPEKPDRRKKIK
jgi:hypothetical protein